VTAEDKPYALLERVFREEAGQLTASLVRLLGDFDLAEELVSMALVEALEHWPRDGIPERPTSWLLTTARRKGLDLLRRESNYRSKLALLGALPDRPAAESDDRLRLIFTCCHPVLAPEAQIALTLRAVVGLTTREIARAFITSEQTLAKRIVRAKRKIVEARVGYRVPTGEELMPRLAAVLEVIYLVFNEGYLSTAGSDPIRRDLASDAEWLSTLLRRLLPQEPEVMGLAALVRLHLARWSARLDSGGRLVLLEAQDRSLWDRPAISDAIRLIERAAAHGRPGRYQMEAMIAALHCEAASWAATDWRQIAAIYTTLSEIDDSPVVLLNRAIALSHVVGARQALATIDELAGALSQYGLFHATRASLLRELGCSESAAEADLAALRLTDNTAERALISERLALTPARLNA
jgi:predicted RNA polymerase sigma factor